MSDKDNNLFKYSFKYYTITVWNELDNSWGDYLTKGDDTRKDYRTSFEDVLNIVETKIIPENYYKRIRIEGSEDGHTFHTICYWE